MGALVAAARDGQHGKVAELVGKGTDVNQTDGLKYTALHYAARKGVLQVRVYRFPRARMQLQHHSERVGCHSMRNQALPPCPCARAGARLRASGHRPRSLLTPRPPMHARTYVRTTPHTLCCAQTVELLLKAGARVDLVNTKGQNALYQAVVGGHTAVARMLIEHGSDVNCRTRSGLVPLHFAARSGPAEIVQLLLGGGANMEEKTAEGMTALHIAKQSKQAAIVDLLVSCKQASIVGLQCSRAKGPAEQLGPAAPGTMSAQLGGKASVRACPLRPAHAHEPEQSAAGGGRAGEAGLRRSFR